jgi:hypothetical protein
VKAGGESPASGGGPARALLQLEISAIAAERARADLLVVPVFCDERPLRAAAGRADWRLCGRLSQLAARGRFGGRHGEAVLAATFGGLSAPLVLALGLGRRSEFDAAGVQAFASEAVRRALGLRIATLALPMPEDTTDGADLGERQERLLFGAADALAARARGQPAELRMTLLVREDELSRAVDLVRTQRPLRLPASVSLRISECRERPEPRGRAGRPAALAAAGGARSEPAPDGRRLAGRPPAADSVK